MDNLMHMHTIANKLFGTDYEWSVLAGTPSNALPRKARFGVSRVDQKTAFILAPEKGDIQRRTTKIRSIIENLAQVLQPLSRHERLAEGRIRSF